MNSSSQLAANLNFVASSIAYYDIIINLAVGVPLNLVNALVFTRLMLSKTNKTNMGFLGLCQSIIDITMLVYFSLVVKSMSFFAYNISNANEFLCKFVNISKRILTCLSSWMEVVTTFDRFIFVIFGHGGRFKFMKHKRYLALIIFGVLILNVLINITNLFYYIAKGICTADNSISVASDMVLIIMRLYIPIFLMIVFNLFMIRIVLKKSRAVERHASKKEHLFTISVMIQDAYILLLVTPVSIYYILYDINLFSGAFNGNPVFTAAYNVFGNVTKDVAFYVQTFSFFIYLGSNKLYRHELLYLIGLVIPIKWNLSVIPSNNSLTNHQAVLTH